MSNLPYTNKIDHDSIVKLQTLLANKSWEMKTIPYAVFQARGEEVIVTAYNSGKLVVQGKKKADFIQFILEPEILKTFSYGYEKELALENFHPHIGVDESGKGDFFGPLVIAAVHLSADQAGILYDLGIKDSKAIKNEKKIKELAKEIKKNCHNNYSVVKIGPDAYNRLYNNFKNLNQLLAWGHAKAIENTLEKVPDCTEALSDQFGAKHLIKNALQGRGRQINLTQRHKAEEDIAVAAASIIAREQFLLGMEQLAKGLKDKLPLGCGAKVKETALLIAREQGVEKLDSMIKKHFKPEMK